MHSHRNGAYQEQLTQSVIETADHEADALLPFEPTQAELDAYAAEWDAAATQERAFLATYANEWDITTLVIGKNIGWKQEINLGARNNGCCSRSNNRSITSSSVSRPRC